MKVGGLKHHQVDKEGPNPEKTNPGRGPKCPKNVTFFGFAKVLQEKKSKNCK